MSYFPLMIQLEHVPVLLVGGGRTARRKAAILREFGAALDVVAPAIDSEIRALEAELHQRAFVPDDLNRQPWRLVVAATDERAVNRAISEDCKRRGIPVNVVDDPELCTFIFPAIIKQQDVVCAVSSGGHSPLVTQWVKRRLQQVLPKDLGIINEAMGRYRKTVQKEETDPAKRKERLKKKLMELLKEVTTGV